MILWDSYSGWVTWLDHWQADNIAWSPLSHHMVALGECPREGCFNWLVNAQDDALGEIVLGASVSRPNTATEASSP